MMASVDDQIIEFLRKHEEIDQAAAVKELTEITKRKARALQSHISEMDGKRLKKEPRGRRVALFTKEHWVRSQRQSREALVAHTVDLKPLLRDFRGQLPVVDEHGAEPARDGVATSAVGVRRPDYDPALALPCEGDVRFDDLLFHLDQLDLHALKTQANPSSLWLGFKDAVRAHHNARDALENRCKRWVEESFALAVDWRFVGEEVSDHCVNLLFDQAMAAASGNRARLKLLREGGPEARVEKKDGWLEYRRGGQGIVRVKSRKWSEKRLKSWVEGNLTALSLASESDEFGSLAVEAGRTLRHTLELRAGLKRALEESEAFVSFSGVCRFVQGGATD
jgi:hypothetical protein